MNGILHQRMCWLLFPMDSSSGRDVVGTVGIRFADVSIVIEDLGYDFRLQITWGEKELSTMTNRCGSEGSSVVIANKVDWSC